MPFHALVVLKMVLACPGCALTYADHCVWGILTFIYLQISVSIYCHFSGNANCIVCVIVTFFVCIDDAE